MTVALAAVAAAALVLALTAAWAWRRSSGVARRADAAAEDLTTRLGEAADRLEQSEQQRRAAEVRAGAVEVRLRTAEQRATEAERRAGDAEKRVAEAMRRADEAARAAAESDEARAVWGLERLRVEREWLDVVGPNVDLPVPWDGTVAAVVATELAVIREVMGTPSELAVRERTRPGSPALAALTARMSVEMLRLLARSGEEMAVELTSEALTVVQPLTPGESPPDLTGLVQAAMGAGLDLSVDRSEGRSTARLELISRGGR